MTPTTDAPTATSPITAVQYFTAKLAYEMTPWKLKGLLDKKTPDLLILDVRGADSWAEGHLPGAVSLPLPELAGKLASLPKDKTIVTYCGNIICSLAPKAALELAQKGFKVMELFGGIAEWKANSFPIEKA